MPFEPGYTSHSRMIAGKAARKALIRLFEKIAQDLENDKITADAASKMMARVEPVCAWVEATKPPSRRGHAKLRKKKAELTGEEPPEKIEENLKGW